MLHVIADPPDGRWSYQKTLVDDGRNILFSSLGTVAAGSILAFRLDWGGRVIPVTASARDYPDELGQEHRDYSHVQVNGAGIKMVYGLDVHMFSSEGERAEAEMIAVECVLVFGAMVQGYVPAVVGEGKEPRTLSDFGYSRLVGSRPSDALAKLPASPGLQRRAPDRDERLHRGLQ